MAKKIDDGKSQIVLIAAIIIIAAVMIFGMFSKGGKSSEKSVGKAKNVKISQNNGKKSSKTKKSKEKKEVEPEILDGYQVLKVSDGDTINIQKVENGKFVGEMLRIRMYGMDAPEKTQDYGSESRQALEKLVTGKNLSVEVKNKDRYGRTVAVVRNMLKKTRNLKNIKKMRSRKNWGCFLEKDIQSLGIIEKKKRRLHQAELKVNSLL